MQCIRPITIKVKGKSLKVPCLKCVNCRIAIKREWTIRMLHELKYHDDAVFVTLTYTDDNMPENRSLVKSDLQKFFKRLRKRLEPTNHRIKYFACGEYSPASYVYYKHGRPCTTDGNRPHYHAIIFGLGLYEYDKQIIRDSWTYCDWRKDSLEFGSVTPQSIEYVAKYIETKLSGPMAEREYADKGREPVFRLLSAGLGLSYVNEYADSLRKLQGVRHRGTVLTLPRYYLTKLNFTDEELKQREENSRYIEAEQIEKMIGINITEAELFGSLDSKSINEYYKAAISKRKQTERNYQASQNLK